MYMCIKPCEGFKDGDKCVVVNLSSDNHRMFLAHSGSVHMLRGGYTFYMKPVYSVSWSEFKECFVEIDN